MSGIRNKYKTSFGFPAHPFAVFRHNEVISFPMDKEDRDRVSCQGINRPHFPEAISVSYSGSKGSRMDKPARKMHLPEANLQHVDNIRKSAVCDAKSQILVVFQDGGSGGGSQGFAVKADGDVLTIALSRVLYQGMQIPAFADAV